MNKDSVNFGYQQLIGALYVLDLYISIMHYKRDFSVVRPFIRTYAPYTFDLIKHEDLLNPETLIMPLNREYENLSLLLLNTEDYNFQKVPLGLVNIEACPKKQVSNELKSTRFYFYEGITSPWNDKKSLVTYRNNFAKFLKQ